MRLFLLAVICFSLSGCGAINFNNLFDDYATKTSPSRNAVKVNNLSGAIDLLEKNNKHHSNFLLNKLERGRLFDLHNMPEKAQVYFEDVYKIMQEKHFEPKVRIGSGFEQGVSLLTNDSAIKYIPSAYEMSMLHGYKALNFVYKKNIESALIEVRRANKVQMDALRDNQRHIDSVVDQYQQQYPSMDKLLGSVKNGFQNAYTFYLSGLIYEAANKLDDAYIDYKKAYEIQSENEYLENDLLRLSKQQGFDQDYSDYVRRFKRKADEDGGSNQGQIIALVEQGLIPKQYEFKLHLPIRTRSGEGRFYNVSVPYYKNIAYEPNIELIRINDQVLRLKPLVNIESLAAKSLQQKIPGKISRQILRLISKEKIRGEISHAAGSLGNLVANIYNLTSEQADTRSWLTLPNQIGVVRQVLDEGQYSLEINELSPIVFPIKKNRLTLVYITSADSYFNYHVVQL